MYARIRAQHSDLLKNTHTQGHETFEVFLTPEAAKHLPNPKPGYFCLYNTRTGEFVWDRLDAQGWVIL
jgi:hypothetical protein